MSLQLTAAFIAIFVWWAATGAVMLVARRAAGAMRTTLVAMTVLAGVGAAMLFVSSGSQTVMGTYLGFFGALALWAWHEATFLLGVLTGGSNAHCPPSASGWKRFKAAFAVINHHEIAIFYTAMVLAITMWGAPNPAGFYTFLLLWAMRISAKLIIFSGAPNAISELMPQHMAYLTSYFRTDRISPIFAVSLSVSIGVFGALCYGAVMASAPFAIVGHSLLAAFMGLAILEHLFLVLPIRDSALWTWALPKKATSAAAKPKQPQPDAIV